MSGPGDPLGPDVDALLARLWSRFGCGDAPEVVVEGCHVVLTLTRRDDDGTHLSPREIEIIRLIAEGLPNKAVALVLSISEHTVASHLRRVFVKLGASSRAEVVAVAIRSGFVRGGAGRRQRTIRR